MEEIECRMGEMREGRGVGVSGEYREVGVGAGGWEEVEEGRKD